MDDKHTVQVESAIRASLGSDTSDTSGLRLRQSGAVTEGLDAIHKRLGTRFIGCSAAKHSTALLSLITSLRSYGCVVIAPPAALLDRTNYPAALWLTIQCPDAEAERLMPLTRSAGLLLTRVAHQVYTLLGEESSEPFALSVALADLTRHTLEKPR